MYPCPAPDFPRARGGRGCISSPKKKLKQAQKKIEKKILKNFCFSKNFFIFSNLQKKQIETNSNCLFQFIFCKLKITFASLFLLKCNPTSQPVFIAFLKNEKSMNKKYFCSFQTQKTSQFVLEIRKK